MAKNLGVAMAVRNKNMKKMAKGGPVSAKGEERPMPDQIHNDAPQADMASKKPLKQADWTDQPTLAQAQSRPKVQPIQHPRMVKSDVLQTRLMGKEDHLQSAAAPMSDKAQPPKEDNEMGADRQGPKVHPLKMMAKGGMLPAGSEADMAEHPPGLESDDDMEGPKSVEYMAGYMAAHKKYAQGGGVDGKQPISAVFEHESPDAMAMAGDDDDEMGAQMAADGGMIDHEMEDEKHSSIAAAIMARKGRKMMAEGGQVDIEDNAQEEPNGLQDLNEAALKENYDSDMEDVSQPEDSNEMGDEHEDESENKMDRISAMRSRMSKLRK